MQSSRRFVATALRAQRRGKASANEVLQRLERREERLRLKREKQLMEAQAGLPSFAEKITAEGMDGLMARVGTRTVQINIGLLCNQTCTHCHVEAGPARILENMDAKMVDRLLELIRGCDTAEVVDITGGAPEMNKEFRRLVREVRQMGLKVIDRCNLTVLSLEGQEDLAQFLADQGVEVVASMPCYSPDNVDAQRGDGVFDKSIEGLQKLNAAGYGDPDTGLTLNLVYNPGGPFLPPPQASLEAAYKEKLLETFGIRFTSLFTITNLPVKRFADDLRKSGQLSDYMHTLVNSFNAATVEGLMCRDTVSISWKGDVHDCDFNQQLAMPLASDAHCTDVAPTTVWNIKSFNSLVGKRIGLGAHCYGCTAGSGSSCGGALA
eukprot:TRINITY_DN3755_c0_g2_i2.p2 TRINITY_DN3755_c0_g2~~TRINITY_DN3755_c0_g2_i2.p2  ORF type:complete len:379 (+),score=163.39 TRINITY_DN3755_c0_g2_i2:64-1200(+)